MNASLSYSVAFSSKFFLMTTTTEMPTTSATTFPSLNMVSHESRSTWILFSKSWISCFSTWSIITFFWSMEAKIMISRGLWKIQSRQRLLFQKIPTARAARECHNIRIQLSGIDTNSAERMCSMGRLNTTSVTLHVGLIVISLSTTIS